MAALPGWLSARLHLWQVHDGMAKCVRGDDNTKNLSIHHNVIWNCGMPTSDKAGQSFGGKHAQHLAAPRT